MLEDMYQPETMELILTTIMCICIMSPFILIKRLYPD